MKSKPPLPAGLRPEGSPFPLGASWLESEKSYNFALYSKHAYRVVLLFFGADNFHHPVKEIEFDYLINKSGPIWHCRVPEPPDAVYYAYRIEGPDPDPDPGIKHHDLDFEKLLLDQDQAMMNTQTMRND